MFKLIQFTILPLKHERLISFHILFHIHLNSIPVTCPFSNLISVHLPVRFQSIRLPIYKSLLDLRCKARNNVTTSFYRNGTMETLISPKTKKPCHFRPHFKSLKRLQSFPNSRVDDFSSERRDSKLHGNGSLSASCSATTKRSAYFQRTTPYFLTLRKRNGVTAY